MRRKDGEHLRGDSGQLGRLASCEEAWLEARHGEACRTYRSGTGKWWPARLGPRGKGGGS